MKIKERLETIPLGKPFTSRSLTFLGTRSAVDKALSRMAAQGEIMRLARGVYAKPKPGKFVASIKPSPDEIARAVAETEDYNVRLHGAKALQLLGLSTQEPMQPVFITDEPTRNIRYGKLNIRLKHVSPSKISANLQGKAALALSALLYLGKDDVTQDTIRTIRQKLSDQEYLDLLDARQHMPSWLSDLLYKEKAA
ncbi:DUF6088 family protein [Synergistaceae bacterium OttesenSCG-928-I11]|nr:DUF6088 family protein [Synergistaceae bacterium OttesenSCG-928-I11]